MYEVYESTEGKKKTYLVFNFSIELKEAENAAAKFFKVSKNNLAWCIGWILNDGLYFEDPHNRSAKKRIVFFWYKW